jgi:hypothetical protein
MRKTTTYILLLLLLTFFAGTSCKKAEDVYLYEVNEVTVNQPGVEKNNLKTELEFISLAYTDLFGATLSENQLYVLLNSYVSMGDKALISDIIIRNFLNDPGADIPSKQQMQQDPGSFISGAYKKFYLREPGEYERWYFINLIANDPDLTPEEIYYGFLTSDEYRFY